MDRLVTVVALITLGVGTYLLGRTAGRTAAAAAAGEAESKKTLPPTSNQEKDELCREQLARSLSFFGEDGMSKIQASFVIIGNPSPLSSQC